MRLFGRKKKEKKVFNENCVYAPVNGKTASWNLWKMGCFLRK